MLSGLKLPQPKWDSTKVDQWSTFATDFESLVECLGGERLVQLLDSKPQNVTLQPGEDRWSDTEEVRAVAAPGEDEEPPSDDLRLSDLTVEELALDKKLYHILKLSITGPSHDMILHVQSKSFLSAFDILRREHGAANCLRKTALIGSLFGLSYNNGSIADFKQEALNLLRQIYQADVQLEDIIMACLLNAFDSEDFQAFKLMTAKQIDSGERINLFDHVQSIANSVELAQQSKHRSSVNRVTDAPGCTRCGQSTHDRNHCYAKRHKDGRKLTDRPPAQKPKKKGGKGKAQGSAGEGGKLSDLLANLGDQSKVTLDQVKSAVAQATSLRVKTAKVSESESTGAPPENSSSSSVSQLEAIVNQSQADSNACRVSRTVVLDTGSGVHLSTDSSVLDTSTRTKVAGFDGNSTSITDGKGNLGLTVKNSGGQILDLTVHQVDRLDGIPEDILSLGLLTKSGFSFIANDKGSILISPDGDNIPVRIENGIFVLDNLDKSHGCNFVRSNQQRINFMQIHTRLGHASHKAIIDTLHNTYGLIVKPEDIKDFFCPVCALTKSIRQRISTHRNPDTLPDQPLQVFHADIKVYPKGIVSKQGFASHVIYVDLYSDFIVLYGLKRKSDAPNTLRDLELLFGLSKLAHSVTIVTDGDGAFRGPYTEACNAIGIRHDFTPPYTPQHNRAERAILRIDTMARVSLVDAPHVDYGPHYYEASKCASYVHNRVVGTRGKTPYELVKHQQPMIKHLIPFGCKGYLHAHTELKRKQLPLGHRAEEVIMLGYRSPFSNQWRVEVQSSPKRVTFSIHVDWDEDSHGMMNVLSDDHLEAIMDEAGIDLTIRLPNVSSNENPVAAPPEGQVETSNLDLDGQSQNFSAVDFPPDSENLDSESPEKSVSGNLASVDQSANDPNLEISGADGEESPLRVPGYYGHNAAADIDEANIIDYPRARACMISVLNSASTHRVMREVLLQHVLETEDAEAWFAAIDKEMTAILEHTAVIIPEGHPDYDQAVREATPSRIILTEKRDGRKKARWVVQGCFESKDKDDFNLYAHTASLTAFRTLCFRRDRRDRTLAVIDIITAFLQSHRYDVNEPARWIKLKDPRDGKWQYYRLLGPIYGQRSAPVRWEETFAQWLQQQGFTRGENDRCVYYRSRDDISILVYVDDVIIDGDEAAVRDFIRDLRDRFEATDPVYLTPETPIDFLGIIISVDHGCIRLSMESYHRKLLANMGMSDVKPIGTPLSEPIQESENLSSSEATRFRSGLGGVGWLASTIRPDLAYAFSRLGQHMASPTVGAMEALNRVLRYISGTTHAALEMPLNTTDSLTENIYDFFCDSDHAGNREVQNERRSQSGRLARLNGVPVEWHSSKQSVTTISSTEAEIYAASSAVQAFMHLGFMTEELGIPGFPQPFQLYIDNRAAEIFMEHSAQVSRLKHIDCRLIWVKQMRDRAVVIPCGVASSENLSDIFTKILPGTTFRFLRDKLITLIKF